MPGGFWLAEPRQDPHTLVDLVNRVIDRGVVVTGNVTISVAGVDLVYLGLNAVLTSVSAARALHPSAVADAGDRSPGRGDADDPAPERGDRKGAGARC